MAATIELVHALGLRVVAEGIEDEATLLALRGLGCDLAQGYHLSRPLAPAAFAEWLDARPPSAATSRGARVRCESPEVARRRSGALPGRSYGAVVLSVKVSVLL